MVYRYNHWYNYCTGTKIGAMKVYKEAYGLHIFQCWQSRWVTLYTLNTIWAYISRRKVMNFSFFCFLHPLFLFFLSILKGGRCTGTRDFYRYCGIKIVPVCTGKPVRKCATLLTSHRKSTLELNCRVKSVDSHWLLTHSRQSREGWQSEHALAIFFVRAHHFLRGYSDEINA